MNVNAKAEARNATATDTSANTGGRAALLFDPAALYGRAALRLSGSEGPDTDNVTVADFERLIRMTSAKIRAGDRGYIVESLLGQSVWLQALAVRLADYMTAVKDERRKIALGNLLMKVQTTATKSLATLAGVACIERR